VVQFTHRYLAIDSTGDGAFILLVVFDRLFVDVYVAQGSCVGEAWSFLNLAGRLKASKNSHVRPPSSLRPKSMLKCNILQTRKKSYLVISTAAIGEASSGQALSKLTTIERARKRKPDISVESRGRSYSEMIKICGTVSVSARVKSQ